MFTYSAETNWVISWEEEGESEDEQYVRFRVGFGHFYPNWKISWNQFQSPYYSFEEIKNWLHGIYF